MKTPSPTVSIVATNYNYGRFVGEAINSALCQTYPGVEVIVVDDGSKDDSRQAIESWGNRVRAIFKQNGGQASAMNVGFAACKGELILFLDSDDVLKPEAISTSVQEWSKGLGRVAFPLEFMDANGGLLGGQIGGTVSPGPLFGPFNGGSTTSGTVFSRGVLERVMPIPEEGWSNSADIYLNAGTSLFGAVKCLRRALGMYRLHGENYDACAEPMLALRRRLQLDLRLHQELSRLTEGKIAPLEDWLGACPGYWERRMRSFREAPESHPWPDTLPYLTHQAIKAAWRHPSMSLRRKITYTILAVTYRQLPERAARVVRRALGRQTPAYQGQPNVPSGISNGTTPWKQTNGVACSRSRIS